MLRAHLFFGITVPAAFLAFLGQPLVEHSLEAVARPAGGGIVAKGDRLSRSPAAPAAQVPVSVEITGLGAATVTLRNAAGEIVYRTDRLSNTTLVARDTEVPHVTLRSREGAPVVQKSPTASETPPRRMLEGCEGAVSSLAGQEARRLLPSRCLAEATDLRSGRDA
ncbi:hypothetical protein [uncultured Methylobacterium sp.]|jgi:hypothetical protein|uniref:hypothetical protein n=1 Tax=uncultured Methylobacterium sp. TaxID=157278 RepID=UPI00260DBCFD|nr:hypothetical protein [uncultured Methylobacterium sp.]